MAGSTGKRYGEEFKLMILEMHKKGKTIRELSSEYKISPHTISYWKNQKKREMKVKYKNEVREKIQWMNKSFIKMIQ